MKEKYKEYILKLGYTLIFNIEETKFGLFAKIIAYKSQSELCKYFSSVTAENTSCTDVWNVRLSPIDYNLLEDI